MHLFVEPAQLRSLAPTVSPALEHAITKMLVKEPDARPQDMSAVLQLLEAASAETGPVPLSAAVTVTGTSTVATAFPPSTFASSAGMIERTPPPPRRRRRLLAGLVGAGLGVGGIVAFSLAARNADGPATTKTVPVASPPPSRPSVTPAPVPPPPAAPVEAHVPPPVLAPPVADPPPKRPRKVRPRPSRPDPVTVTPPPASTPAIPPPKPPEPKPACAKPPCKKLDGAL